MQIKVSIVTVVLNNADTIKDAIESVLSQDYPNIEYVVVDGQSTDGTLDIIHSYGERIHQFVSERDAGLYYAMNKGLGMCTGDVIGILNADDFYAHNKVISRIVRLLEDKNTDTAYADLQYVKRDTPSEVVRHWQSGAFNKNNFVYGWMPPHPTFFVKASIYEKYGKFDTTLRSAADYELMLRLLYKHKVSAAYLPEVTVKMRAGGASNKALKNRLKANNEDRLAWQKNGLQMPFYTPILKPLRKLPQFFKKK